MRGALYGLVPPWILSRCSFSSVPELLGMIKRRWGDQAAMPDRFLDIAEVSASARRAGSIGLAT